MWTALLLGLLGLIAIGLITAISVKRRRLRQRSRAIVDDLLGAAEAPPIPTVRVPDCTDLPRPVHRYLTHVLSDEQPHVQTVQLQQTGTFRSGRATAPWNSFTATQHVTTHPPGFVWDASITMLPGLSVRVLDAYANGHGALWARLGGVVPVADPTPGPALDEGELLRYLAEAPLYPTALLPGLGVTWTPVGDRSARATLRTNNTTASLLFHFNERHEVARITGKRPFLTEAGTYESRPWKGYWRNYECHGGLRIPTDGEVAWIRPEGEVAYWRGHLEAVAYQFVPRQAEAQHRPDSR